MKNIKGYTLVFSMDGDRNVQTGYNAADYELEVGMKECLFGYYCEIKNIFVSEETQTVFVAAKELEGDHVCEDDVSN